MTHSSQPFICFSGIAPTIGDTAIGQSILQALKTRTCTPVHVHSPRPDVFGNLPEITENDKILGTLPDVPVTHNRVILPLKLVLLLRDLRATGGRYRLSRRSFEHVRETLLGCAAVVFQGGPSWNDRWTTPGSALRRWLFLEAARYYGAHRYHVGVSCGPFAWPWPARAWTAPLIRNALNCHDIVFVRDAFSRASLDRLGVTARIVESTDAAVFLRAAADPKYAHVERRINAAKDRPRLVVCVRDYQPLYGVDVKARNDTLAQLALVLDHVQQSLANVFFLGTDHHAQDSKHTDLQIAKEVLSRMSVAGAIILDEDVANAAALKYLYSKFDAMISMRLHPTILAMDSGVPCLMMAYDPKCHDFYRSLQLEHFVMPVRNFNAALATRKVNELLQQRGLRDDIRAKYAELRAAHGCDWEPMFEQISERIGDRSSKYTLTPRNLLPRST